MSSTVATISSSRIEGSGLRAARDTAATSGTLTIACFCRNQNISWGARDPHCVISRRYRGSSVTARVRVAICIPSRRLQQAARIATTIRRQCHGSPGAASAPTSAVAPVPKLQIVSTHPELPDFDCIHHAAAMTRLIANAADAAINTSCSRLTASQPHERLHQTAKQSGKVQFSVHGNEAAAIPVGIDDRVMIDILIAEVEIARAVMSLFLAEPAREYAGHLDTRVGVLKQPG